MIRLTPPTMNSTYTNAVRTARKTTKHIPLMARSPMLCGMDDRVKHPCTIRHSIPPIISGSIDSAVLAIRYASPLFIPDAMEVVGIE